MAFGLKTYPIVYRTKYSDGAWAAGEFIEQPHKTPAEEAALSAPERDALEASRNLYPDMPLVSYSTQYGLSVFEGVKALPQKDGGLAIFRPRRNAMRFSTSMRGLYMPPFPEDEFVRVLVETVSRNAKLGFKPEYNQAWEKDSFLTADSIYIRPFTYAEGGIGVNISSEPWVMVVTTPVSAYFAEDRAGAVITNRIRATPGGTGWIKASSNYVVSALAKHEAQEQGYMECIFLDPIQRKHVEEGSSCNIFFYLKSGELVTPELGDTILPGITRDSIIVLAQDKNVWVSERKIPIGEVMDETKECFVCGTAAGATPIMSLTYKGKTQIFNGGRPGEFTNDIRATLKGIQYGLLPDPRNWMTPVL